VSQFNLQLSPDFERTLARLVAARRFRSKSEAVRVAVRETLDRALGSRDRADFGQLRGLAAGGRPAASRRFRSDDDLWR